MKPVFFTEEAYDELRSAIPANKEKYLSDRDWLDDYFAGRKYMEESSIDVTFPVSLLCEQRRLSDEEKTTNDIANVRILYSSTKSLNPLQATNSLMWTCLSHTAYSDYVFHRWIDDDLFDGYTDEKKNKRIARRFFVSTEARSLNDNALSRLWWYGHISFDEENQNNPFHLTEVLVKNSKFCTDFMQTPCCWNRSVGKGVLLAAKDYLDTTQSTDGFTACYRLLKKYLNRYGAVTSIDSLGTDTVRQLSYDYLCKARLQKTELADMLDFEEDE